MWQMDDIRQGHLLRTVADLRSLDEALGFRLQLQSQGEETGVVKVTLEKRIADLVKRS
jgi:hypothetical protein